MSGSWMSARGVGTARRARLGAGEHEAEAVAPRAHGPRLGERREPQPRQQRLARGVEAVLLVPEHLAAQRREQRVELPVEHRGAVGVVQPERGEGHRGAAVAEPQLEAAAREQSDDCPRRPGWGRRAAG